MNKNILADGPTKGWSPQPGQRGTSKSVERRYLSPADKIILRIIIPVEGNINWAEGCCISSADIVIQRAEENKIMILVLKEDMEESKKTKPSPF